VLLEFRPFIKEWILKSSCAKNSKNAIAMLLVDEFMKFDTSRVGLAVGKRLLLYEIWIYGRLTNAVYSQEEHPFKNSGTY